MQKFTDANNRTWTFTVNVNAFMRVKALADYDLASLISFNDTDNQKLMNLANDEVQLARIMYAVCKPSVDAAGVSEDDFYAAFNGDAIKSAFQALLKDYADFFPNPKGQYIRNVVELTLRTLAIGERELQRQLDGMDLEGQMANLEEQVRQSTTAQ